MEHSSSFLAPVVLARLAVGVIALGVASLAAAQEGEALPLWEVGVFAAGVSQQAYPGAGQQLNRALVLPYAIYRGEVLRMDRSGVGVRKELTPNAELNVGFSGAFGSRSNEIDVRSGMPELGTLVEFGPRIQWKLGAGPGQGRLSAEVALRGVFDLTDQFRDKGMAVEPRLIFEREAAAGFRYSASAGLVWADQRLADTLYGVAPAYATRTREAYAARSGLMASRFSLFVSKAIAPGFRLALFTRVDAVAGAANQGSPLVQKGIGATTGFALTYTLAQSQTVVR